MFNRELFLETQTSRCLLCENAPCSHACTSHLPVSEIIRSFRFENHMGAAEKVGNVSCMDCSNPVCMSACRRKKLDSAVEIPEVLEQIPDDMRDALLGVLRSDPRPSYQHDPERLYGLSFGGVEVKFKVDGDVLTVVSTGKLKKNK